MLLEECGDKTFITKQLCDKINLHSERNPRQCCVWQYNRRYDQPIEWAPLKHTLDERTKEFNHDETRSFLSLRLSLSVDCMDGNQISALSKSFCEAAKKVKSPVRRIDWQKLHGPQGAERFANCGRALTFATKYGKRWSKSHSLPSKSLRDQIMQMMDNPHPQAMADLSAFESAVEDTLDPVTPPLTSRKRRNSERQFEFSDPQSKRRVPDDGRKKESMTPGRLPMTPLSGEELDRP